MTTARGFILEFNMGSVTITSDYAQLNKAFGHRSEYFYTHQKFFAAEYRSTHALNLPSTPFWVYIQERYNINPVRFSHYHPLISKWIKEVPHSTTPITPPIIPVVPPVIPPSPPVIPIVPVLPPNSPAGVPEPTSIVMLAIMVIIGFCFILVSRKMVKV